MKIDVAWTECATYIYSKISVVFKITCGDFYIYFSLKFLFSRHFSLMYNFSVLKAIR